MQNQVTGSRFKLAEATRNVWRVVPEEGTAFENIVKPSYWAHVASKLTIYDHIEVLAEDGTFWAYLLVLDCSRLWAKVHVLHFHELQKVEVVQAPETHEILWKGPHRKWAVIRKEDNEIIHEGSASKEQARNWLMNHLKALAA